VGEIILFPQTKTRHLEELVERVRRLSQRSENVYWDNPHVKLRMEERSVSIRQIFDVLRHGKGIDGPTIDKYGELRIKLKKFSAGRVVQVVVVVREDRLEVVTVI
jgi:hypothetical protein